ncbi:MAG: hypothetical protein IPJ54_17065 [Saprospiraceae bacterium]|nr:hypothetical protein [Saprospiraceae bacterium]
MMQLYLSGRRAYIGTGHKVNYDEWDSNFGRVKGSSKKVSTINLHFGYYENGCTTNISYYEGQPGRYYC